MSMCSLHTGIFKKYREIFEAIRDRAESEVTDADLFLIKSTKLKGSDALAWFKGCGVSEKCKTVLESPTPPAKNLSFMHRHLEEILKALR